MRSGDQVNQSDLCPTERRKVISRAATGKNAAGSLKKIVVVGVGSYKPRRHKGS